MDWLSIRYLALSLVSLIVYQFFIYTVIAFIDRLFGVSIFCPGYKLYLSLLFTLIVSLINKQVIIKPLMPRLDNNLDYIEHFITCLRIFIIFKIFFIDDVYKLHRDIEIDYNTVCISNILFIGQIKTFVLRFDLINCCSNKFNYLFFIFFLHLKSCNFTPFRGFAHFLTDSNKYDPSFCIHKCSNDFC